MMSTGNVLAQEQNVEDIPLLPTIPVPGATTTKLPPVEVTATREVPQARPSNSSGLDGATYTQPLSISSYSTEELMALGARDQKHALETQSSVSAAVDYQLQSQGSYSMRGFGAYILRDGFQSWGNYGDRDTLAGVERVDFVKGPGSSLNSGALGLPPGGAIDFHSHWAGSEEQLAAQYAISRYDQRSYSWKWTPAT